MTSRNFYVMTSGRSITVLFSVYAFLWAPEKSGLGMVEMREKAKQKERTTLAIIDIRCVTVFLINSGTLFIIARLTPRIQITRTSLTN